MVRSQSQYWSDSYPVKEATVHAFARKAWRMLPRRQRLRILDLGCGNGADAIFFERKGCAVTAVDFSTESMRRLKERLQQKNLRGVTPLRHDISKKLPFPSGSFDAVYAHLSVHYFDDRTTERIFREMRRVLKSKGMLFVKCKSIDDPLYGKGKEVSPDTFKTDHVRHFFSVEYMRKLLDDFRVLSLRRSSGKFDDHRSAYVETVASK